MAVRLQRAHRALTKEINMRQNIVTGILGTAAFAALALGVQHDADACNTIPPENNCSVTHDGAYTYYARSLVTVTTSGSQNCGCGQSLGNLPSGASVVGAGVFDPNGNTTSAFCGGGTNAATTAAFQNALGGVTWSNAVLNAISSRGVVGGQAGFGVWKISTPNGQFDGVVGVAQVNFGPGGTVTVDPQHQAVANINVAQCADCSVTPNTAACIATQRARSQLDGGLSTFATNIACARTDAVDMLGLTLDGKIKSESDGEESDGGCSATRSAGPTAALLLGLVGVGLAFGRARRRV
jgi:MYXO-CTERM domain-containing protein